MNLVIDVRTREEFVKGHIKDALNLTLFDLEYYVDFLRVVLAELACPA